MGTSFIMKRQWGVASATLLLGSMVKETTILLIPVAAAHLLTSGLRWKLRTALMVAAYLLPTVIIRHFLAGTSGYYWWPNMESIVGNLRPKALLSILFSLGVPGLLTLLFFAHFKQVFKSVEKRLLLPILTGAFFSLLLVIYSLVTAYTDGRFVWPLTVYLIPVGLWYLQRRWVTRVAMEHVAEQ